MNVDKNYKEGTSLDQPQLVIIEVLLFKMGELRSARSLSQIKDLGPNKTRSTSKVLKIKAIQDKVSLQKTPELLEIFISVNYDIFKSSIQSCGIRPLKMA